MLFLRGTSANGKGKTTAGRVNEGGKSLEALAQVACYVQPDEYLRLNVQAAKRRLTLSTLHERMPAGRRQGAALKQERTAEQSAVLDTFRESESVSANSPARRQVWRS